MDRKQIKDAMFPECPVRNVLSRLMDKWTLLVLYTLESTGTMRFNDIHRAIPESAVPKHREPNRSESGDHRRGGILLQGLQPDPGAPARNFRPVQLLLPLYDHGLRNRYRAARAVH